MNKNEMKEKINYQPPQLTAVEFKMERGYGASDIIKQSEFMLWDIDESSTEQMESYSIRNDWNRGNDNHFWN